MYLLCKYKKTKKSFSIKKYDNLNDEYRLEFVKIMIQHCAVLFIHLYSFKIILILDIALHYVKGKISYL